jgi:hypothetical protein
MGDYLCGTTAANGSIVHPPDDTWVDMQQRCNDTDRETEVLGEKPVPVPLCPPQIPHGLPLARTLASTVRSRRLTAWARARRNSDDILWIEDNIL